MLNFLKSHLHPLGSRIIFWNIVLFFVVKVFIPYSSFQPATILNNIKPFDSREVVTATNNMRLANGLFPLRPNFQLDAAAADKLSDMLSNNYFAHTSPTGVSPWSWIKKSQYVYSVAGENLAIGFFNANDTVLAWMNSPSHKANLLNVQYQDIGIAVGKGKIDGSEGIVVVQMFGSPRLSSGRTSPEAMTTERGAGKPALTPKPPTASLAIAQVKAEVELAPEAVSTDANIPFPGKPVVVSSNKAENMDKLLKTANIVYSVYSLFFALLSITAFFLFGAHHHLALRSAAHAAIFISSVAITAAEIHLNAAIF